MVVVKIELWPGGDESRKQDLGQAFITNDCEGTLLSGGEQGDYDVRLMKSAKYAKSPGVWKRGRVTGFPRQRLGPWDLLFRALRVTVGERNRA